MNIRRQIAETLDNRDNARLILHKMVDRSVENRCAFCNYKLFLGKLGEGTVIEIKCPVCHQYPCFGVVK